MNWTSPVPAAGPDAGAWPALLALATAGGAAAGWLLNYRRDRHRDTVAEYQQLAARLQQSVDRLQAQVDEQQRVINRLAELHGDCRAEGAEMYALLTVQHATLRRWAPLLAAAGVGVDPAEVPDLPGRPARGQEAEAEFLRRTTAQGTAVAGLRRPPGGGPDHGPRPAGGGQPGDAVGAR